MKERFILGSESVFRAEVFKKYRKRFKTVAPSIDEKAIRKRTIPETVMAISLAKARCIVELCQVDNGLYPGDKPALIICADQVFECNGKMLEKPETIGEVYVRLKEYPTARVATVSGVCLWDLQTGRYILGVDRVPMQIVPFNNREIEQICDSSLTFKTCSALPSGLPGDKICQMVEWHKKFEPAKADSVHGLPMQMVIPMARNLGFQSLSRY